jgi:hypothetical protein
VPIADIASAEFMIVAASQIASAGIVRCDASPLSV